MTRHLSPLVALLLLASLRAFAQEGSGDLPAPPKAKPKTAARPKPAARPTPRIPTFREPATVAAMEFNQPVNGGLDGQASGRIPPGTYFNEHLLKVTTADLFAIQLQSANPALTVQLTDNSRVDVPLMRDERTGAYKLRSAEGVVPADGEYRVRVLVNASGPPPQPILYVLTVNRTGLTDDGYNARLGQIVSDFNAARDAAAALPKLEALAKDDPRRPAAHEYLGVLYLEHASDIVKATAAMTEAIKLGGAAMFRVTHDSRWRKPERDRRGPKFVWLEPRMSWLKIYKDKIVVADFADPQKAVFEITGAQVERFGRLPVLPIIGIEHANKQVKPERFSFGARNQPEAELVVDLISNHVTQRRPSAPPRFLN
jgi:hypothetical protein